MSDENHKTAKATEPKYLMERLMSPLVAKTELEHFAAKEIKDLKASNHESSKDLFSANALLRDLGYKKCDATDCDCNSYYKE